MFKKKKFIEFVPELRLLTLLVIPIIVFYMSIFILVDIIVVIIIVIYCLRTKRFAMMFLCRCAAAASWRRCR